MKTLLVWFRNGRLWKSAVCGPRSLKRMANQWNEYAQRWNQITKEINLIGTISQEAVLELMRPHEGFPKHAPPEILARQHKIRNLLNLPVRSAKQ
jgi:hypothetical protein